MERYFCLLDAEGSTYWLRLHSGDQYDVISHDVTGVVLRNEDGELSLLAWHHLVSFKLEIG